jgi:tRNA threonylcarbamoyladenosine biosynthesis protein TsaE
MSTVQTWQTECSSLDNTLELAEAIGRNLRGGEVIELVGDLGSGKTAFVRGLAKGLGSHDKVHSPSFTLSNSYRAKGLEVHHYDFHRLSDAGIMKQELAEVLADNKAIVVVEWADLVEDILPPDRMIIKIEPSRETSRILKFAATDKLTYLFPDNT